MLTDIMKLPNRQKCCRLHRLLPDLVLTWNSLNRTVNTLLNFRTRFLASLIKRKTASSSWSPPLIQHLQEKGNNHDCRSWRSHAEKLVKRRSLRCASPLWGRCSASRAVRPAAAMRRWCQWRKSIFTSPGICTPLRRRTTCSAPSLTTISSRETHWALTNGAFYSNAAWI